MVNAKPVLAYILVEVVADFLKSVGRLVNEIFLSYILMQYPTILGTDTRPYGITVSLQVSNASSTFLQVKQVKGKIVSISLAFE